MSCVSAYRDEVAFLAEQPLLHALLQPARRRPAARDGDREDAAGRDPTVRPSRARNRTSDRALPRFTREHDGQTADRRGAAADHPRHRRRRRGASPRPSTTTCATLAPHWRRVVGGYTLVDIAHKVVGVGSVGLRAYVALLEGSSPDDVVFLQLKQARRSVLARYVHGDSAWHAHQGQRVVEYQQALQTVSDPLLGWTTVRRAGSTTCASSAT